MDSPGHNLQFYTQNIKNTFNLLLNEKHSNVSSITFKVPFYKPVEQREKAFSRCDEFNDDVQNPSGHLGGAPTIVAIEAPAALNARLQRVGNSGQLLC